MQNHGQLKEVLKIIYIFILTAVKNNMKKKNELMEYNPSYRYSRIFKLVYKTL